MGGFTIETEATTGNKYLLFTHPTSLTYFDVPNPNEPFEILNNPNFTIGQTAATAAQSLYKWYLAGDVSISPSDNGGTVTFEHSSGSATLQQKIIKYLLIDLNILLIIDFFLLNFFFMSLLINFQFIYYHFI